MEVKNSDEVPAHSNEIREYYNNTSVFITGGTGFLGKLLLEKLLRGCPEISTIYILVRNKRGQELKQRIHTLLQDVVFEKLLKADPDVSKKIVGLHGDVAEQNLGLSDDNRKLIAEKVSVIFHAAATVKFDAHIKQAVVINVQGTKEILLLAKTCKKLTSFVYVSTAFCNCQVKNIDEKFYDMPLDADEIIKIVEGKDEEMLTNEMTKILGEWPNSYVFTKAIAENVVKANSDEIPIAIFRPAVVIATYEEPLRGWIDNVYGATGLTVGAATGVLHTYYGNPDLIIEIVPGDLVVNGMIACSYQTARQYSTRRPKQISIYNYVSSVENPISTKQYIHLNKKYGMNYPTIRAVWYYSLYVTNSWYVYMITSLLFHLIPGLILDGLAVLTGQKPQLLKIYKKMHKLSDVLSFFSLNSWTFTNSNTRELWNQMSAASRKAFPFSMAEMSWERHSETHTVGLRTYLLKESMSTLPEAKIKWRRLYILHNFVKFLFLALTAYFTWSFVSTVYDLVF